MDIKPIYSGGVSSNAYLILADKTVLVDPGMDENALLRLPNIDIIINTHCHF
ncbi:MAG: MBL fold metallo-hydrolase, partial [Candidatus Altiarchaeota archaeon]|nr:MBL fold metallo-hydrolase [Candidatus Altiarchaeota archaeon]